jgi:hypothetical protein
VTTKDDMIEQLRTVADDVMDLEFSLSEKRRQRDALIVSARTVGVPLRAIGEACMISHQTVQNIVARAGLVPTTDEPGPVD